MPVKMGLLVNNMGWLVDSLCGCFHDEKGARLQCICDSQSHDHWPVRRLFLRQTIRTVELTGLVVPTVTVG